MDKIKKGLGRGLSSLIGESKVEPQRNHISISDLVPNKYQPRKIFDENNLKELTDSIKERGMIQPIIVRKSNEDKSKFEIIAGERRWLAAQRAGLHNVPVVITIGTLWRPALCAANHLLSPAIISNFDLSLLEFLTIIGCIIPLSLIEFVRSTKLASSNIFLGWYLFATKSLIDTWFFWGSTFVSPIKDDRPLPKPFLILSIKQHSQFVTLDS